MTPLAFRVAARFQRKLADQSPGARSKAQKLTTPINRPKGIDRGIVKENALPMAPGHDETVDPNRRDIRPQDVFSLTPNNAGVLNLVETGRDLQKALNTQVPKDKGYDTVSNLSQYLIKTEGGGGTPPVSR